MSASSIGLKLVKYFVFFILTMLGVLFLLAAPVDPSSAVIRLIIGVILIFAGIVVFVVFSLIIQKKNVKVVKVSEEKSKDNNTKIAHVPSVLICQDCKNEIILTEALKMKEYVICETCGKEIKIPKDNVNW